MDQIVSHIWYDLLMVFLSSDSLSKHESVFCELLNEPEKPPSLGPPLRTLMKLPLDRIKCYAYLLTKLSEYYAKVRYTYYVLRINRFGLVLWRMSPEAGLHLCTAPTVFTARPLWLRWLKKRSEFQRFIGQYQVMLTSDKCSRQFCAWFNACIKYYSVTRCCSISLRMRLWMSRLYNNVRCFQH